MFTVFAPSITFSPTLPPLPGASDDEDQSESPQVLTARQHTIAVMVADGMPCEEIAQDLYLPLCAVQGYLYRVLEILGLRCLDDLSLETLRSRPDMREAQHGIHDTRRASVITHE